MGTMLLTIDIGNTNPDPGPLPGTGDHRPLAPCNRPRAHAGRVRAAVPGDAGAFRLLAIRPDRHLHGFCRTSPTGKIQDACQQYMNHKPLVVDTGVKTGVRIRYEDPRAVGADRIVDAAAVQHLYGGPACVVDFGTGTTFDAISRKGITWAGRSPPALASPQRRCSSAPPSCRVDLQRPPSAIGRNGACAAVRPAVRLCISGGGDGRPLPERAGPDMKVIATGGLADAVARETDVLQIIAPGSPSTACALWELNVGKLEG